ncbi:lipoprotein [Streptosporangium violaceochromogenes]|nr:lipoprotein [Streptosporangium violaceochromogenes]
MRRLLTLLATALPLLAAAVPAHALALSVPRPHVPAGVTAGYVVFDRRTGTVTSHRNAHRRFRSASVVKILIAIDYLESHPSVPRGDLALLAKMLRVSDDAAATSFWTRGGQGRIVERTARRLKLTDTAPPPADKPGFWGYTSLSAMDVVRTYRYLLDDADPRVSGLILGHLRRAGRCGSDGFDQFFGIPRAVPAPWAVKQGWSGYGSTPPVPCGRSGRAGVPPAAAVAVGPVPDLGRPVLHTTGLVGPKERWIMVLLTAHPSGATWRRSTDQMTGLAGEVYRDGTS